ncbi:MAG TPA: ATP-binding protein [Bacteroidales bacterium]|nr:ATP-binding protein [Bacteroidales bacterium]
MILKQSHIGKLIAQGEHQCLDFKFEISDSKKIARSISAFANTDGGTLLIGVKDNGKIAGVRSDEEIYMAEAAAQMYCQPAMDLKIIQWTEEKKTVLEIIIPKLNGEICYAQDYDGKWIAYVRVDDKNFQASPVHLRVWKRKLKSYPTHISYTEKEKKLLDHLTANPDITLKDFCTLAGIKKNSAETILVNLIMLDIIEIFYTEQAVLYRLK